MDVEYLKNNFPVSIYAIYHKPYIIVDSDIITPISPKEYGLNMLTSDTGDNIASENNELAEYTTFYWVWKNNHTAKYVGFFHYRRHLCFERFVNANDNLVNNVKWDYETLHKLINDYDFILPPRWSWDPNSVYTQYATSGHSINMEHVISIVESNFSPEYSESLNAALNKKYGYYCNLFMCKREYFDGYMEFAFKVFDELVKQHGKVYQAKGYACLGERLLSAYVEYLKRYTNARICEVPLVYINSADGSNTTISRPNYDIE